jgi:hypothetical protein
MAYHDGIPFNGNMLRPCPMLENPTILPELVKRTGAHSTDLEAPEKPEELCAKTAPYAERWAPVAERIWNGKSAVCSGDCSQCPEEKRSV